MPNKMLIDASHPEETRVVVVRGNRIEEFDFESQAKKQLKGNIYLARVTRVEPSLQAAFVEYGGNRHGFLAFSEIHPDYYQIPVADRQALLAADAAAAAEEEESESEQASGRRSRRRRARGRATTRSGDADPSENGSDHEEDGESDDVEEGGTQVMTAAAEVDQVSEEVSTHADGDEDDSDDANLGENGENGDDGIELVGSADPLDEVPDRGRMLRRQYKIQEVIKRRQIMLVQVVKEERGNKGAALTTYLSLAGRYSVLMPNTARGGGISRKITAAQDRKRLKEIVKDLEVPQGMGVILRTAGANRTKSEIKRDYEYLMRLWVRIRSLTLESTAPALVHEEGSLIKRSVRDLYNRDIDQILVAGEEAYREAKDFMRMLMPSHAKVVQPYREKVPIFARNGIEAQLDRMLQPQVTLKSGGYIIINQTEALVAIDVNSGRSTREHSIESTALQTNLEAAEEVARQLRLRDLAGLIVIDFIDMEEKRNNRAVEKRLKDCLKNDRARIQVGRISHFGLLEMSRQRIRSSVLESTMRPCEACHGTGFVRTDSSVALHVLRGIEEHLLKDSSHDILVRTRSSTALYMLNHKRHTLSELEERFGLSILIEADDSLGMQHLVISRGEPSTRTAIEPPPLPPVEDDEDSEEVSTEAAETSERSAGEEGNGRKKRRRRRRRKSGDGESQATGHPANSNSQDEVTDIDQAEPEEASASDVVTADAQEDFAEIVADDASESEAQQPKKRRRGRRGGQRSRSGSAAMTEQDFDSVSEGVAKAASEEGEAPAAAEPATEAESTADVPQAKEDGAEVTAKRETVAEVSEAKATVEEAIAEPSEPTEAKAKPARKKPAARKPRTRKAEAAKETVTDTPAADDAESAVSKEEPTAEVSAAEPAEVPASEREAAPEVPAEPEQAAAPETEASAPKQTEVPASTEPVVVSIKDGTEERVVKDAPKKEGWWSRRGFF